MEALNTSNIEQAYFLGIGGIGMSAIARYLNASGVRVSGYDKTPSPLTLELEAEGIHITYEDSIDSIPAAIAAADSNSLIVLTPAIPADHKQWNYFKAQGREILKRSEVLGLISRNAYCIAVAGTHGKTTTSTLIAHLLHSCGINFTAFLGGISSNYNTNYLRKTDGRDLFPGKPTVVLEADEFDRSFHHLSPDVAVITAADPDHLDIYHTHEAFFEAFEVFAQKIVPGGTLVLNKAVKIHPPADIHTCTYGIETGENADFSSHFTAVRDGYFYFNYSSRFVEDGVESFREVTDICAGLPGFHNIENATAALGICLDILNLDRFDVKQGIKSFKGVKRRFEYISRSEKGVVIDDYAHHPQELSAIISSVRELYPNSKLTGIFQPHLFTRTRDFAEGFAASLSELDSLWLMDIYPARELPLEGITSSWLLEKVSLAEKQLVTEESALKEIRDQAPELLLILGAGDIDRIVPKVKKLYEQN
jgi:UDP-N-acetylmuramate--alanine ligase